MLSGVSLAAAGASGDESDAGAVGIAGVSLPTGGGNAKVNGPLVVNGNVSWVVWSPDSSRIAYTADQDTDGVDELYVGVPDGSVPPVKVSQTPMGGDVLGPLVEWRP